MHVCARVLYSFFTLYLKSPLDEGYGGSNLASPTSSFGGHIFEDSGRGTSRVTSSQAEYDVTIWDRALHCDAKRYLAWESIGK